MPFDPRDASGELPAAAIHPEAQTNLHNPRWALHGQDDDHPNAWSRFRHAWREELAEFWGCFFILLFGAGVECQTSLHYGLTNSPLHTGNFLQCRITWAAGVAMAVYASGGISGGHCNPIVTLALTLYRGFPARKAPGFMLAQTLGAALGGLCVYANYAKAISIFEGGAARTVIGERATAGMFFTIPQPWLSYFNAGYTEFLCSAVLVIGVFAIADRGNLSPPKGVAPVAIFLLILGIGSSLGINTGYAMNGARDTGPRIALSLVGYGAAPWTHDHLYWLWAPWGAGMFGGVVGGVVYDSFLYTGRDSPINQPWKGGKADTVLGWYRGERRGSGKTTLLQHILRSDHGLRIAIIVNDIGSVNVDANLIKAKHCITETKEQVVALQNGCICCTLRGDLLAELVRLAEVADFDYVIIESSGISEPEQVAETFDVRLIEQISTIGEGDATAAGLDPVALATLKRLVADGGLDKFARLDTTCTVIDVFTMFSDFETADLLSSRRDDVVAEDERTVSDLMVDQIEFADVLVLNKVDAVSKETLERAMTLIRKLNHRAALIEAKYGQIDPALIVNTGSFSLERAQTGYGWLQDLHAMTLRQVNGKAMVTPKPETEEYNVRNFVYIRRRPFHPRRLFEFVYDKFVLQAPPDEEEEDGDEEMSEAEEDEDSEMEDDEDDSMEDGASNTEENGLDIPDNSVILANRKNDPLRARLFRSKGEYWLATRPKRVGEWSQAGAMLTLQGGRPWFCTVDKSEWETGNADIDAMVAYDLQEGGQWGDRRQEIVFIGEGLDVKALEARLDRCLLDDREWKQWQNVMMAQSSGKEDRTETKLQDLFDDDFPDWPEDEGDHAGHDHAGHSH